MFLSSIFFRMWQNQRQRIKDLISNVRNLFECVFFLCYHWWWKFNNFYNEKKIPKKEEERRRETFEAKTIDDTCTKLFFLWKHVFLNSIFRCYSEKETEKRIFKEKVIRSIYFKLVRLFIQIAPRKFLKGIFFAKFEYFRW